MSTTHYTMSARATGLATARPAPGADRPLHRLATVRRGEGISQNTVARRLGTTFDHVLWQEQETSDLLLSTLYRWQEVLRVPAAELLVESGDPLSPPVAKRAQMVRLAKTAQAIRHRARQVPIQRLAEMLVEQLVQIMPELEQVTAWPEIGQPRSLNELGQVVHRRLSDNFFTTLPDSA